jgi:hypothetical protein
MSDASAMNEAQIKITVKWRCTDDFHRGDLIAKYLREHLPTVLSKGDIQEMDSAWKRDVIEEAIHHVMTGQGVGFIREAFSSKRYGWDDFFLFLDYEVSLET